MLLSLSLQIKLLLKRRITFEHVLTGGSGVLHGAASDRDGFASFLFSHFYHTELPAFSKGLTNSFPYGQMTSYCIASLINFCLDLLKQRVCVWGLRHHLRCMNSIIHICCVLISLRVLIHFVCEEKSFLINA